MKRDLTSGSVIKVLIMFAIPYFLSSFLQTFYGMADLYIVGQFNNADVISAVSIGSQFMHMLTVVIIGLTMGTTIRIGNAVGRKDEQDASRIVGNTVLLFIIVAIILTIVLLYCNSHDVNANRGYRTYIFLFDCLFFRSSFHYCF